MYLLRRHPQNHQENDSSQKDAKVIKLLGHHSRAECIYLWFFFSFLLIATKFALYYDDSVHNRAEGFHNILKYTLNEAYYEQVNELRTALGPLSGRSLKFCTDACLRRYLEARNWNVDKAKKMLEETFKWRSAFKPEEIRWVSNEFFTCFRRHAKTRITYVVILWLFILLVIFSLLKFVSPPLHHRVVNLNIVSSLIFKP